MFSICLGILLLLVIPLISGGILLEKNLNKVSLFVLAKSWMMGWLLIMGMYLPLALIVIFFRGPFLLLNILFGIELLSLSLSGGYRWFFCLKKPGCKLCLFGDKSIKDNLKDRNTWYILMTMILIAMQFVAVVGLQTENADDAWYVNTAVSTWYTGHVSDVNASGVQVSWTNMADYVLAPWPVFCASISEFIGIHPTIFMHSILPGVVILLAYVVYFYIACQMCDNNRDEVCVFIMIYALLNVMSNFSTRSVGVFLLQRPWQGKALMTAIFIPMLFVTSAGFMKKSRTKTDGIMLFLNMLALNLVSSMSVPFSGLVYGSYMVVDIFKNKSLRRFLVNLIFLIPDFVIGILFIMIKMGWLA